MICEFCGTQVPEGNKFCTNCGAQLPQADAVDAAAAPQGATTPQVQMPTPTYQPYQQSASSPNVTAANMPSKGAAIALIVVGFLCGIIWGIIGVVMYTGMSSAMAAGDAATASSKFRNIAIATGIGVVLNILIVIGSGMMS